MADICINLPTDFLEHLHNVQSNEAIQVLAKTDSGEFDLLLVWPHA